MLTILGNTDKGLVFCTKPDNTVYVYHHRKSETISLPKNIRNVLVESEASILYSTTGGVFRYNLFSQQVDTLLWDAKLNDLNPEGLYSYGYNKLFIRPLDGNLIHLHDGGIDTLKNVNTAGIGDIAVAVDENEIFLLMNKREIRTYNLNDRQYKTSYLLKEGFPDLQRIACNSIQLIGLPSASVKWRGGIVTWILANDSDAPEQKLFLSARTVSDMVVTDGGVVLSTLEDGFRLIASSNSGEGKSIYIDEERSEMCWNELGKCAVIFLIFGLILGLFISYLLRKRKASRQAASKLHNKTITYEKLYEAWNERAFTNISLETFIKVIDSADFGVMIEEAAKAGQKAGFIGGVKYIMKSLRNYLGKSWYQKACDSINETPDSINKLNDGTKQIRKIDTKILPKLIK